MPAGASPDGRRIVAASGLLCVALGTIHAFSVFLAPLEQSFGASRSEASLAYSIALVSLTAAVLMGPRIYGHLPGAVLVALAAAVAALGAVVSAFAPGLPMVWVGYGVIFGAANGVGYGFCLQISARANPGAEGIAMGAVTACYAIGAFLAPALFLWAIEGAGYRGAMLGLAAALVVAGLGAAALMRGTRVRLPMEDRAARQPIPGAEVRRLWLAYGAGVAAGLMVIGHAAEIARLSGMAGALWLAPTAVAALNMAGSLAGGRLADRVPGRALLVGLPLVTCAVLIALAIGLPGAAALVALASVGGCYGAAISVYPALIAKTYGMAASARVYGRVFTAWGLAGLTGPWLAGALFDATGGYTIALTLAAGLSIVSALVAHRLPLSATLPADGR